MNVVEFNFHAQRAYNNADSLEAIYAYSVKLIREHVYCKFGRNFFDPSVPHDVFTKIMIDKPVRKFISSPSAYLCKSADNYIYSLLKRKDNCTLELHEGYAYYPDYSEELEFSSIELETAFNQLDSDTKYIIYLNIVQEYKLKEVANIMGLRYDYVRTRKSRALKILKKQMKKPKTLISCEGVRQ